VNASNLKFEIANRFGLFLAQGLLESSFQHERRTDMLNWVLWFLIFGLIAGLLGFTALAGTAAYVAQVLFVVFLVLFLVGLLRGGKGKHS